MGKHWENDQKYIISDQKGFSRKMKNLNRNLQGNLRTGHRGDIYMDRFEKESKQEPSSFSLG